MQLARAFLIGFVLAISSPSADAVARSLDPTKRISQLIKEFRTSIDALIKSASLETQVTVAQSVKNLTILLQNVERTYSATVDATVKDLRAVEIDALERASNLIDQLGLSAEQVLNRPLNLGEDLSALLANGYLSNKPLVTRYSPTYIAPSRFGDTIRIVIEGLRLHTAEFAKPRLEIGDDVISGHGNDTSIVFSFPRSLIGEDRLRPQTIHAKLILEGKADSLLGWATSRPQRSAYDLSFVVLPSQLGDYNVSGVEKIVVPERSVYVPDPAVLRLERGAGEFATSHCYRLPDDLEFDLSTAKVVWTEHVGARPGGGSGIRDPNINAGQVGFDPATVPNKKEICIKVTTFVGCTGCSGISAGKLVVETVKRTTRESKLVEANIVLGWDDVQITINDLAPNQAINVSVFGGPRRTIPLVRSGSASPFADVLVYTNQKLAIIRPKVPSN